MEFRPKPERYSRTADTIFSHSVLARLKFAVVGAGALGNEVVKALGLLGAGSVLIIDPDEVELSNLSRSVFFRPRDCEHPKAEVLAHSLADIFPNTRWRFHHAEIADVGAGELADLDLLFSCTDNELARVETAWLSLRLDIPVSDGGLGGPDYWRGRVSFFRGRESACFCCKLSPTARRWALRDAHSTGQSCWSEGVTSALPSTPTMAAIIGSLQVDFGLRCWTELQSVATRKSDSLTLEISLDREAELRRFTTSLCVECPLHRPADYLSAPLPHADATARELLDALKMECVEFDWPVCVAARCLRCQATWRPMKRLGWLRRRGACPDCGARAIREDENLSGLSRSSAWADTPLIKLGLPQSHHYMVH
jgi:molybdopterin/thiamine biosynthesis adenylyltransferase